MNEATLYILLAAACLFIGGLLGNYFARLKHKSETAKLEERLQNKTNQEEKLNEDIGSANAEINALREEKEALNIRLSRQAAEFDALSSEQIGRASCRERV